MHVCEDDEDEGDGVVLNLLLDERGSGVDWLGVLMKTITSI